VQPRSLGVEGRRKLQDALDELAAARQIIETALAS
jgi:hypothetical protein